MAQLIAGAVRIVWGVSLFLTAWAAIYDGQRRGALTNYQCDKWYALSGGSTRTCMGDGNWDGEVPECSELMTALYIIMMLQ